MGTRRNDPETDPKSFLAGVEIAPTLTADNKCGSTNGETAMTAIAKAISNAFPTISPDAEILKTVALLCGVGLVVSLLAVASFGLDMSAGFF
jgi:hypothetical protein